MKSSIKGLFCTVILVVALSASSPAATAQNPSNATPEEFQGLEEVIVFTDLNFPNELVNHGLVCKLPALNSSNPQCVDCNNFTPDRTGPSDPVEIDVTPQGGGSPRKLIVPPGKSIRVCGNLLIIPTDAIHEGPPT